MDTSKQLVIIPTGKELVSEAKERLLDFRGAIGTIVETFEEGRGKDFWVIPGTGTKSLLQRGASKLVTYMQLREEFHEVRNVERWDGPDPFFFYLIECRLYHVHSGLEVGRSMGACSTKEPKYYTKRDGSRQDPFGNQHTVLLMARKRALVSVARRVSCLEGDFTQDMEDFYDSSQQSSNGAFDPLKSKITSRQHAQWLMESTGYTGEEIVEMLGISRFRDWEGTLMEAYNAVLLHKKDDAKALPNSNEPPSESEASESPLLDPEKVANLKSRIGGVVADEDLLRWLNINSYSEFTGNFEEAYFTAMTEMDKEESAEGKGKRLPTSKPVPSLDAVPD